jgi:hypothetical protein
MLKKNEYSRALTAVILLAIILLMVTGAGHMVMSATEKPIHCQKNGPKRASYIKPAAEAYLSTLQSLDKINELLDKKSQRYEDSAIPKRLLGQLYAIEEHKIMAEIDFWRSVSYLFVKSDELCDFETTLMSFARAKQYDIRLLNVEKYTGLRITSKNNLGVRFNETPSRELQIYLNNYLDAIYAQDIDG